MYTLELIKIESIIETEEHIPERVEWLKNVILQEGVWRIPLILERNSLALMDGHHRFNVAKSMGLKRVPAILLDYYSDNVIVNSWRDDVHIDRDVVLQYIKDGKTFPHKTTRHIISPNPDEIEIPLSFLF
jgi:uncharacterized protein (DUF1015 family)